MKSQVLRRGRRVLIGLVVIWSAVDGVAAPDVTLRIPIGQEKRFAHAMILTERNGKKGLWLMIQPRGLIMVIR